ncbi:hypothetical protein RND71_003394 [Anisodus tanguticus]|uniref:Pyruvate dehydrogenase E1 component subunit beta n=1 Tax=Anisodus tanguticus TaxID=243964 RepID=A0AAE1ST75_9SOLA|nr:hypothetical protein RND71_003394 [Anisodus tanguticus]
MVREALNSALDEEMAADPRVSKGLLQKYGPDRVVDTPITEAGFTGLGTGAAYYGLRPVLEFMTFNFAMQARYFSNFSMSVFLICCYDVHNHT